MQWTAKSLNDHKTRYHGHGHGPKQKLRTTKEIAAVKSKALKGGKVLKTFKIPLVFS